MTGWLKRLRKAAGLAAPSGATLQGFWHGPALGPLREACLASFVRLGHRFELYVYEPVAVPPGVSLKPAGDIIPFDELFYYQNPRTASADLGPFSDLFRFKLLSQRGGWWSDVDTICLSPDIPAVERAWAQELPEVESTAVGTSQIAFAKGDPVVTTLYARCLEISRTAFPHRESLGPHLISATIHEMQLPPNMFGSPATFYPVRWIEMFKLWLPEFRQEVIDRANGALFMPIFQSFPQYIGLTLGKLPPHGTYLADVCSLNGMPPGETYDAAEIRENTRRFFLANADWAIDELRSVSGESDVVKLGLGDSSISGATAGTR